MFQKLFLFLAVFIFVCAEANAQPARGVPAPDNAAPVILTDEPDRAELMQLELQPSPAPLADAAKTGDVKAVKTLLSAGADVNQVDAEGRPALQWAAQNGHLAVVKLLIDRGASVNAQDVDGYTPLDGAKDPAVKKYLIANGAKTGAEI